MNNENNPSSQIGVEPAPQQPNEPNQDPNSSNQPQPPKPEPKAKTSKRPLLVIVLLIVALLGGGAAGYALGNSKNGEPIAANEPVDQNETVTVPDAAVNISECAKGRGAQYVLPENIPTGPVYNVHEGRVIGIEFMVARDELLDAGKDYLDLPLHGANYDHVNVGLLSQGHAGFPEPHYHVDVMMIPTSETDKITCE